MGAFLTVGARIRNRRMESGIRQSDLARQVGISPAYLNLIEHNRRRIGGKTLIKLAGVLEVDPVTLSEGAEAALIAGLRDAASGQAGVELNRAEEFAGRFPGWASLVKGLHTRQEDLAHALETLNDRLAHDPYLAESLHEVISAVTAIRATASILVETERLEPEWQARFHRNIEEDSRRLTEGAQALVRYLEAEPAEAETHVPQDEIYKYLAGRGYHLAELEQGAPALAPLLEAAGLSPAATDLLAGYMRQYRIDAAALPFDALQERIAASGPDPQAIADGFAVPLPQVFRRLAAMPEDLTGPLGLVICDGSGTIVFRKPLAGFALPRGGGACTLWPLFQSLAAPERPIRQRLTQAGRGPDIVESLTASQVVVPAGFDRPALYRAHMLIRPDHGGRGAPVQEVGINCRICPRPDCPARREPSAAMPFDSDAGIHDSLRA